MISRRSVAALSPVPTSEECEALAKDILRLLSAHDAEVDIQGGVNANTAFARGDTNVAAEGQGASVSLRVTLGDGRCASCSTTRTDPEGLAELVRDVEAAARDHQTAGRGWLYLGPQVYPPQNRISFESVAEAMKPEWRTTVFDAAIDATEAAGLIGAGQLGFFRQGNARLNTAGLFTYQHDTYGEFSLTARTKDGTGSGWAWGGFEDWARVDVKAVIARAVDLGRRSANPVAIEPGRYTVILEPSAVASLVEPILTQLSARMADGGGVVFSKEPVGTNKLGMQMLDRRLGLVSDPWDPDMPRSVIGRGGYPLSKVVWFERGVLTSLSYDEDYARDQGREAVHASGGARLTFDGKPQTLEEMIASTKRGVWVNRLSNVSSMNLGTLLQTGTTRDGTFLIENGKITKPIKNFRFTESPFFVLNKVEAGGTPVRASYRMVAPRLKVRDFDFTSLTDAV